MITHPAKKGSSAPMKNLLLFLCSLAFTIGLLEIGLRILDVEKLPVAQPVKEGWIHVPERVWTQHHPIFGWYHLPNVETRLETLHVDVGVKTNSQGFRGDKDYVFERASEKRIVALGDSFTFGFGVSNVETFMARIESQHQGLEALNMGVCGYGIDQMLLSYRKIARKFSPDYVLIGVFPEIFWRSTRAFTDAGYAKPYFVLDGDEGLLLQNQPVPERYELKTNQFPQVTEMSSAEKVLSKSLAYRFVKKNIIRLGKNTGLIDPDLTTEWIVGREILGQLVAEIRTDGATPVIMTMPPDRWVRNDEKSSLEKSILRFASRHKIPAIDLTEVFQNQSKENLVEEFYIPGDGHWSSAGHAVVAETILKYLKSEGYLKNV